MFSPINTGQAVEPHLLLATTFKDLTVIDITGKERLKDVIQKFTSLLDQKKLKGHFQGEVSGDEGTTSHCPGAALHWWDLNLNQFSG